MPPPFPVRTLARAIPSLALAVALLGPSHAAFAADSLATMIEEGRFAAAYERARSLRAERAGEPLFDFYYGLAAVEQDELSEAVFALERALIARPGFDRARLELARAYFLQGDDRRARRAFETVQAHDPPAAVDARIERYLRAIRRRADRYETTVSGYLEIGAGHDSNVNSATADETVEIEPLFGVDEVTLDDGSREQSDWFTRAEGRARVSSPVAPDVNLIADVGARGRFFADEDGFDRGLVDGRFGAEFRGDDWRLRTTLNLGRFFLDGEDYRDRAGLSGMYQLTLTERSSARVSLDVIDFDYDTRDTLDSTLWVMGGGLTRTLDRTFRPTVSAQAFLGAERADSNATQAQADAERDIYGIQGGLRMWLSPAWTLRGSVEARYSDYEEAGVFFSQPREEEHYQVDLGLDWRPRANWRIGPHLRVTDHRSNNDLYDYDRTEFQIRARYDFY